MATTRFIAVRYGDAADIFLSSQELLRSEVRLTGQWRAITKIVGAQHLSEPLTHDVHSPRALPAFLGHRHRSSGPSILWDAGLGTLFNQLSFTMPYPQPPRVVEASVRRIAAVRCVIAGQSRQAATQMQIAETLLEANPIDRTYQMRVDAEDQFEVYQLSEHQEEFTLAHELAHYIKAIDPDAFHTFETQMLDELRKTDYDALRLGTRKMDVDPHGIVTRILDSDLDPYAWYLQRHRSGENAQSPWPQVADDVPPALALFDATTDHEREEMVCDILAATAVSLEAHRRRASWNTAMAAACSRLALSNLHAILGIDAWVREEGCRPPLDDKHVANRERCMNAFLPVIIPAILNTHGRGADVKPNDLHLLMHLVEDRFTRENKAAFDALTWESPPQQIEPITDRAIILGTGFMHLRPPADHRVAHRGALKPLFNLGEVEATTRVYESCADPAFARTLEAALVRHQRGEWDNLPRDDKNKNLRGLYEEGEPATDERRARRGSIWSYLETEHGPIWIITSQDRTRTTVEYAYEH